MDLVKKWPRDKALKIRTIIDRMNLCGCGSNAHWECVLELLQEAETHSDHGFYRDKWYEFGAKVLDSWGLLDHGTGIGFAWLTEDGKLLLEFLHDFGLEDADMNDETGHPCWAAEFSWEEQPAEGKIDIYQKCAIKNARVIEVSQPPLQLAEPVHSNQQIPIAPRLQGGADGKLSHFPKALPK